MTYIRQGDILFTPTEKTVAGSSNKRLTIAEGEVTGHHHVLIADANSEIVGDKSHFTIKGTAKLVHPEHDTIPISAGNYIVSLEREFDYADAQLKTVAD